MTTEVQVDRSCLPPVREVCRDFAVLEDEALAYCLQEQEIEQHYASNIQKSRLFQKDLRVARRLQDLEWEAAKIRVPRQQKQREERDPRRAREEKEWRDSEGYRKKKAEKGKQETAPRRPRDSGEERSHRPPTGSGESRKETLSQREEEPAMQSREQLWQDEALARKVQEEERSRLVRGSPPASPLSLQRAQRKQEQRGDYRAAQVAQDEEIARYIQDQELKAHWRRPSQELAAPSGQETRSLSELKWKSPSSSQEEAQQTQEGRYVPARATTQAGSLERPEGPARGGHMGSGRHPFCRNIAEELDPTFRAKGPEHPPPEAFAPCPQAALAAAPTRPLPLDGLFDYLDATAALPFVSPTKRQPEKVGHQKPRDKREGCKQQ